VEERHSSKFIEETIRYKNLEWSFSCSHGDRVGHSGRRTSRMPHYHFQMKVGGRVIIDYGSFHIPFNDYDEFCFAVKESKFDRLRDGSIQGAGMQALFDHITPEELVEGMRNATDEKNAQLHVGTLIEADEGTTISGDKIAELYEESRRTGKPMAKLVQRLKNVRVLTIITPGPGVPDIAARKKGKRR